MAIFGFLKKNKNKKEAEKSVKEVDTAAKVNNEETEAKAAPSVSKNSKENVTDKKAVETPKNETENEENEAVEQTLENASKVSAGYTGKFEINKSKDGKKFFFNLYASNKVGIATSQMYSSSQAALNGVKSVIANAEKAPIEDQSLKTYETLPYPKWEIYVDNGGKFRFRLNASNGSCVCHSQGYTTKNACKNGIDSIIRSSKNAEIDKTYITKKDDE